MDFMSQPTKIMLVTDSPVLPSGLGETTRLIFSTLIDKYPQQYELHQIGLFHCYAVTTPRWPIYPTMARKGPDGQLQFDPEDKYGEQTFLKCAAKIQPDIVFAFGDPRRVFHLCAPPELRRHRLILYVNFDGMPLPQNYASPLLNADLIFTKSEFSKNVLACSILEMPAEKLGFLYSPADIQRFAPLDPEDRAGLRRDLLPDWMPRTAFVFGWVGRNQWRKQVWVLYKVIHYLRSGAYLVCEECGKISPFDWDPVRLCHLQTGAGHPGI